MPVIAVVGGQWGDEGKGKIIDLLADRAHVVVRSQGGDNAGHTVVNPQGTFALHLIPAGIFNPATDCLIGPGVALNPDVLLGEIDTLGERGVVADKLVISPRAHLVLPYHLALDQLEEDARGARAIGTTKRGIGPTYVDKVGRVGLVVGDLQQPDRLRERVSAAVERRNLQLARDFNADPIDPRETASRYEHLAERLRPYIADTEPILDRALRDGRTILLEGAHGTLLDVDHGSYPFVTTSSCTVGGLLNGAGIGPRHLTTALGVFKAYATRVGAGPMPTELGDEVGAHLRERGQEYGTTTGRPRRCGWFDAVAARHSVLVNGFHALAVTRLDILDELDELKVCTAYKRNGQKIDHFPSQADEVERCRPLYEELKGWASPTGNVHDWKELPTAARDYVRFLEDAVGVPAGLIGVGREREKTLFTGALP